MVSTAILIDNMYLENAINTLGLGKIDAQKYPEIFLRADEKHYMTYIFDALPFVPRENATDRQKELRNGKKAYLDALEYYERLRVELGYVKPKMSICHDCGKRFFVPVQKLVDVRISVRLMTLAWQKIVKKIVLVSGDSDLIPAVESTRPSGTIVRLEYFNADKVRTSKGLIRCCQEKHQLSKDNFANCNYNSNK